MPRSGWRRLASRALIAALAILFLPSAASSETLEHELRLEVFVNGATTGLIGTFRRRTDGRIAVASAEWKELGFTAPANATAPDGLIDLDRLPGLSFQIHEAAQSIHIEADNAGRLPQVYDLRRTVAEPGAPPPEPAAIGGVLNYLLYGSIGDDLDRLSRFGPGDYSVGVNFDARLFAPLGVLSQTGIIGSRSAADLGVLRLDTTWTYSDPAALVTYRAGDLISGGLSWSRPVRLAGIQIQRNFSLRPDLVTLPIRDFSGSAAVPSTVDVYLNNLRTFSRDVAAGPFELRNLPVVSGPGVQRIVLRDALGRETITEQAFYATPKLLRAGLSDFSLEAGFPRRDYALHSNHYDSDPVVAATLRGGFSDSLTVELHGEGAAKLLNAGMGVVVPAGNIGVASLAVSGSNSDAGVGAQLAASFEAALGRATLYARTQRSLGDYADIATITSRPPLEDVGTPFVFRPPRALDQIGLSFPLAGNPGRIALTFTHVSDGLGERHYVAGASFSRPLGRDLSFFATAFKDFGSHDGFGIYAGLTRSFGGGISGSTSASVGSAGSSVGIDLVKAQPNEIGSYGWRLRDREGSLSHRAAAASYRAPFARLQAGVEQFDRSVRASGEMEGAIAAIAGDVFLANRIDDAFAVVDAGAPDVEVRYENRPAGKTDARGKLFLANLRAYQRNRITIDPKSLPVDADIPRTKEIVTPTDRAGAIVRFAMNRTDGAALVSFRTRDGAFVPAGSRGVLDNGATEFLIGYDGETFLGGLQPMNSARITRPDGSPCEARFAFTPRPGSQVRIEGVPCL